MLQKKIDKHLEEEDIRWKKRTRQKCLRECDRNTKIFSPMCKLATNTNKGIKDNCGNDVVSHEGIVDKFQTYF